VQFESRIKNQLQIKQTEQRNADDRLRAMKRELRGLKTGDQLSVQERTD
jgi:hypothetical protein